jgi:ribose 5-phosphate isomerase B
MKIILGADHGGFLLKEQIKNWLQQQDYEVVDAGAYKLDPQDDYPLFAFEAAKKVSVDEDAVGILFCRSGAGMTIAANKVKGVRAVEVFNSVSAEHAKQHNNANMIALSADWLKTDEIKKIIKKFLTTKFTAEDRHQRRIDQIKDIENQS